VGPMTGLRSTTVPATNNMIANSMPAPVRMDPSKNMPLERTRAADRDHAVVALQGMNVSNLNGLRRGVTGTIDMSLIGSAALKGLTA
jgi:hypothetical protein